MDNLIVFLIGFAIGALIISVLFLLRRKDAQKIAEAIIQNNETDREKELQQIIENLRGSFSTLSLEALSRNTTEFLKLANETLSKQVSTGDQALTQKKALIDQTLQAMKDELNNVQKVIKDLEGDRVEKFGALANWLKESNKSVKELMETTGQLKNVLSSSKVRGQWGERMAEDILRLSGLKEGINYLKQKALQSSNTRPDFTFLLPNKLVVNMDVKFPFDNYLAYNNTDNETEKEKYKNNFLKDIRTRIKEVTTRDYINPSENTVDYVLVFIPNEQIYAFILEHDKNILDESLKQKVILCSPITLYAILAVIRQAVDNFSLEKRAAQIIEIMNNFHKQWEAFTKSMEKMGRRIEDAKEEFERLMTTRRNQLEKPLSQINQLRQETGINIEPLAITSTSSETFEDDEKND